MRVGLVLAVAAATLAVPAAAGPALAQDHTVTKAAGPQYGAGALYRMLFGREYRRLWTSPITVPVLDLATFEGGLRAVKRTGGQQTLTLMLRNPEGRLFFFRSLDKDPSTALPPELRNTVAGDIVRDQTSSALPGGPLVAQRLMAAAGVLHGETRLVALPDDPLLGEFRPAFAGVIGTLEQGVGGHWGGAEEIIDSDTLGVRTAISPADRVDALAFLTARLLDVLMGDWDRHRGQWFWARFGAGSPRLWRPVPLDRDQAFVKYDGFLLSVARQSSPQLTNFGREFPGPMGAAWNGRDLDRRYLVGLDRSVWDSVANALRAAVTDGVIDSAVADLPPPHDSMVGPWLAAALRARRDRLPEMAGRYYRLLAGEVDVHATEQSETAIVSRDADGSVTLTLTAHEPAGSAPYLVRRFRPDETNEVRLFLHGGADTAIVRGEGGGGITLRVLAADQRDQLIDSARNGTDRFYNPQAATGRTAGLGSGIDRRHWAPPPNPNPLALPPRDWGKKGQWTLWGSFGPDIGLFLGTGHSWTNFGFRKLPFASKHKLRAGFATGPGSYRAEYRGEFHRENSGMSFNLLLRASGIEVVRFHGFGNETPATGNDQFYRVTQDQFNVAPSLQLPLATGVTLSFGPTLKYVSTDQRPNRFLATLNPYGSRNFGELGGEAALVFDGRDRPLAATRGARLRLAGAVHPAVWDVRETFGEVSGETLLFLSPHMPLDPTLALRAGGRKLWGAYPYFEAAFIGSPATARLGRENRFAGDASAYGSAELRLALGRTFVVVPADFGIFGLADVGRVWLEGESSDVWHEALGGGLWLGFLSRANTLSIAVAASDERTRVYVQAGFGF